MFLFTQKVYVETLFYFIYICTLEGERKFQKKISKLRLTAIPKLCTLQTHAFRRKEEGVTCRERNEKKLKLAGESNRSAIFDLKKIYCLKPLSMKF
jgi:hypothetical protein